MVARWSRMPAPTSYPTDRPTEQPAEQPTGQPTECNRPREDGRASFHFLLCWDTSRVSNIAFIASIATWDVPGRSGRVLTLRAESEMSES